MIFFVWLHMAKLFVWIHIFIYHLFSHCACTTGKNCKDSEPELEDHVEEVDIRKKGNSFYSFLFILFNFFPFQLHAPFHLQFPPIIRFDWLLILRRSELSLSSSRDFWNVFCWEKLVSLSRCRNVLIPVTDNFYGMGKEVENLIMENNELLATKWDLD